MASTRACDLLPNIGPKRLVRRASACGCEVIDQAALADARLARDEDERPFPGLRPRAR